MLRSTRRGAAQERRCIVPECWMAGALLAVLLLGGCAQYRERAMGVTPATECPDYSRGCSKTVWNLAWGAVQLGGDVDSCGSGGLAEVTVRDTPPLFLINLVTLGLVAPKRVEWKCSRPNPATGSFDAPADTSGSH